MAEFARARLQRVTSDEKAEPVGDPIEVQFNPNSLKLAISNANDTGKTVGRQKAQYLGTGSATLTVELTFDTADEGTTDEPKSVLDKTTPVEQLLLPQGGDQQKQSPPTVRFEWGRFILTGLVESMNVDLDLFSESGVPLRARVGLSIKEQKSDFEFMKKGAGANKAGNAVAPGKAGPGAVGGIGLGASASLSAGASLGLGASAGVGGGIGLGSSFSAGGGLSASAQTAVAIDGESAAEFAARVGVDPAAWRAVAAGQVDATLSIPAGVEIDFSVSASAAAGVGATVGAQAGIATSLEASFGLAAPPKASAVASLAAPGFALSAAGGVSAALETVSIVKAESAVTSTRQAFGVPASAASTTARAAGPGQPSVPTATLAAARRSAGGSVAPPRPDLPEQSRVPLKQTTLTGRCDPLPSAPPAPQADPRAVTFGSGVPLRPRIGGAVETRRRALHTVTPAHTRSHMTASTRRDPTRAPWMTLAPAVDSNRTDTARPKPSGCSCGCGGGCGCGSGARG